uniref:ABC transmembrane type-1 domain-containing protein n=1 Tax=Panagrolaimus superbus TaxID=310955 RepID=A0A914YUW7_9BILA
MFGLLLAAICGICQPVFAILSGRLANTLLLMEIEDPQFLASGIQACLLFVGIGAFLVVIAFIQFCCFNIACTRITRRIRNAYLLSILRQNPSWFEKNHSGALNTKLNE